MILLELNQYFPMNSKEFKMCMHVHVCCECVCVCTHVYEDDKFNNPEYFTCQWCYLLQSQSLSLIFQLYAFQQVSSLEQTEDQQMVKIQTQVVITDIIFI